MASTVEGITMKVLVTGATGYIGAVAADALVANGHEVLGLARSARSADALRKRGIEPAMGDFGDVVSLTAAITETRPDAVVSTASVGASSGDNASTFARDREAVRAMAEALAGHGGALVFTSGSAVFGTFSGGDATDTVYDEDTVLPLPRSVFAASGVHPLLVAGFGDSMAARVETERTVLTRQGVRGIVVRPGLVYGRGGNSDLSALIARARTNGRAGHWGSGGTLQSYVHVEDLAELYRLAVERAPHGAVLHGAVADVSQRELALAINRMIGADERTEQLSLGRMLGMNPAARLGLTLTQRLPVNTIRKIGKSFSPPPSAGSGISLSLNKRMSARKTRELLDWSPTRTDILRDIESGSYAN
jgi:nucleoside-diphosphate-sugar epimerase